MKYDFLIVGTGLYGSVMAHELNKHGKSVLMIDKRNHVGGNVYCKNIENINVHAYGPHIFHTSDEKVWNYVNSFVPFNRFTYSPMANYKGKLYNLPFNMNTFYELWGTVTPEQAVKFIQQQVRKSGIKKPGNLEEQAISMVGKDIYKILVKGYTEKQWGRSALDLPTFIIKRLPVRFTYDNNYFNDDFQGIPIGGYNKLVEGLIKKIPVYCKEDFFETKEEWLRKAHRIIYTGKIDEYFDYCYGQLEYRSLRFEHEVLNMKNYQGCAVINYTEKKVPYTRIIEHKHFEFGTQPTTVITREFPQEWKPGAEPFYPINDEKNMKIFKKYERLAANEERVLFGGRLAEYRYYDMHQIIAAALLKTRKILA